MSLSSVRIVWCNCPFLMIQINCRFNLIRLQSFHVLLKFDFPHNVERKFTFICSSLINCGVLKLIAAKTNVESLVWISRCMASALPYTIAHVLFTRPLRHIDTLQNILIKTLLYIRIKLVLFILCQHGKVVLQINHRHKNVWEPRLWCSA